jgi:hypothetical protein
MVGKHQYFNLFIIFLSLSCLCIQHGMSRPLKSLELKSIFVKSPHNMVVKRNSVLEGHKQNHHNIRNLEIDNSGPSPDGPGH